MNVVFGIIIGCLLFAAIFIKITRDPLEDVVGMGHMKTWWKFGFEIWGEYKPFIMWTKDGKAYKPMYFGVWVRSPGDDMQPKNRG